jgi:diaminohydroxyphosphoribosylaminopyrimidine deaminase/5-amino-6-(5-phosphoribosylamino)uracil reductase
LSASDERWMRAALQLAARGLGNAWPNPAVGCVIVKEGVAVGRGWTQPGGRPHAETEALARAGEAARGAEVFVSLEPCAHHGKTPPCTEALVRAGVRRVVIGCADPDPRVDGKGIDRLRAAGIEVVVDVLRDACMRLNEGFFRRVREQRPLVTLKVATTLDGRIATRTGESRWISGAPALDEAHRLRATHDAILVGIGTALADDPQLTCRLPGLAARSPVRIVLDPRARLPPTSMLARTAREVPVWLVAADGVAAERIEALTSLGVEVLTVAVDATGRPELDAVLARLAGRGITRLLVEGGSGVIGSFLAADRVDRLRWVHAGITLGGDAIPAIAALGIDRLGAAARWRLVESRLLGEDHYAVYDRVR